MSSKVFLQSLQSKLKGGNTRSIHLNALPGRLVTRLDLAQFGKIESGLGDKFLKLLLSEKNFSFKVTYDGIAQDSLSKEQLKNLGVLSKRINSILIENDDYWKEHGVRTLGFGYPLLIKRSPNDPEKLLAAPLFIWSFDIVRSTTKVNEWTIMRNMSVSPAGKLVESDQHQISVNEVLHSFVLGDEGIKLPTLTEDVLEDGVVDKDELVELCVETINALNSGSKVSLEDIKIKLNAPIEPLPEMSELKGFVNSTGYIHFGGVFGLYKTQKESIITDITKLLERFDEFEFENLQFDSILSSNFSAITTDPSQQSIISSLGIENNQIIQGPPGTGKSQSLTALITNALSNNLRCLVVCEKKTALDIIKSNLHRKDPKLSRLVAVIDDVNADREAIVDAVREGQAVSKVASSSVLTGAKFQEVEAKMFGISEQINLGHKNLEKAIFAHDNWGSLVGRYLKSRGQFESIPLQGVLSKVDFQFSEDGQELNSFLDVIRKAEKIFHGNGDDILAFKHFSDELFKSYTLTDGRLNTEKFVAKALHELEQLISEVEADYNSTAAWNLENGNHPAGIANHLKDLQNFWNGRISTSPVLPDKFINEFEANQLSTMAEDLIRDSKAFVVEYEEMLNDHYLGYKQALGNSLNEFLATVSKAEREFGDSFFKNTAVDHLMDSTISVFSSKRLELKTNKKLVKSTLPKIREIQQKQPYIVHDYNDHIQFSSLRPYIENVRQLNVSFGKWLEQINNTVSDYVSATQPDKLHHKCRELLPKLEELNRRAVEVNRLIELIFSHDVNLSKNVQSYEQSLSIWERKIKDVLPVFEVLRDRHSERIRLNDAVRSRISNLKKFEDDKELTRDLFEGLDCLEEWRQNLPGLVEQFQKIEKGIRKYRVIHEWRIFFSELTSTQKTTIGKLIANKQHQWGESFACWYLHGVLSKLEPDYLPKDSNLLDEFKVLQGDHSKAQLSNIYFSWMDQQKASLDAFKFRGLSINSVYNKRGSKGQRRNSLRNIIKTDFDLFTKFFPVLLVNPSVCSSVLPLEEGIFDVVIFDEASQLRVEDTYAALIRGKAKVVSGDKHQMPPSSYFESSSAVVDPTDSDEEYDDSELLETESRNASHRDLAFSESLLDYAENKGFHQSFLDIHYRSQHPHLIDFSNAAIYGNRLLPIPAKKEYVPITYIEVNGLYEERTNFDEAKAVVDILENKIQPFEDGSYPTVGVATFNLTQRNLIIEKVNARKYESAAFEKKMSKIGDSFFVKNLENIQGDERDVIILSTTFGRKRDGSFLQNFGPVGQSKGHRMLNVIVTRARHQMFVCTSFPIEYTSKYPILIEQHKNTKYGLIYAYLAYAKAVSDQNEELRESILNLLSQHCSEKFYDLHHTGEGSESPFEEEVYQRLAQHVDPERIIQQHWVGGFRIDMVIKPLNSSGKMIALECDGAKYHSSPEAYAWDMFRQEQLEKTGLVFHRIWSTNWWDDAPHEMEKLLDTIKKYEKDFKSSATPDSPVQTSTNLSESTPVQNGRKVVMTVKEVFKITGQKYWVMGRLEVESLTVGQTVYVEPLYLQDFAVKVTGIDTYTKKNLQEAFFHDDVVLHLECENGSLLKKKMVIYIM